MDVEVTIRRKLVHRFFGGINIHFIGTFYMCLFCLCVLGPLVCLATPQCGQCQKNQSEIQPEQTPEKVISWGKCMFEHTMVCLYLLFSLMSARTWA